MAAVLKTARSSRSSWVRIPRPPLLTWEFEPADGYGRPPTVSPGPATRTRSLRPPTGDAARRGPRPLPSTGSLGGRCGEAGYQACCGVLEPRDVGVRAGDEHGAFQAADDHAGRVAGGPDQDQAAVSPTLLEDAQQPFLV